MTLRELSAYLATVVERHPEALDKKVSMQTHPTGDGYVTTVAYILPDPDDGCVVLVSR